MGVISESLKDGVFTLILNRPDKKNAMSLELLQQLHLSLGRASESKASVIVIRGCRQHLLFGRRRSRVQGQ